MSDPDGRPSRLGWKVHGGILALGLALGAPVAILDFTLLGPSHGGWISLDFRGLLIGAYAILWLTESVLATLVVAVFRGRSALVTLGAHGAAVAAMIIAGGVWLVLDHRADQQALDEAEVDRAEVWARAPNELTVVAWHRLPDADPAAIEITLRANAAGELGAEYARRPDAYLEPYAGRHMRAGEEVTLTLEVEEYAAGGDGDYVFVEWGTGGWNVPLRFCRPACSAEYEVIMRDLPPPTE